MAAIAPHNNVTEAPPDNTMESLRSPEVAEDEESPADVVDIAVGGGEDNLHYLCRLYSERDGSTSLLFLRELRQVDGGYYSCRAGEDQATIEVNVIGEC